MECDGGMTDRQFDSYHRLLLRQLKAAKEEIISTNGQSKILDGIIQDIKDSLSRP